MKTKSSADWQKVREAYCNSAMPVRDICVRFAVTGTSLYRRIKLESWPKRSEAKRSDKGGKLKKIAPDHRGGDMVSRLSGVFLKQLQEAETAAKSPGASAAERERAGRALSGLLRNYEKLKEHEEMQSSDNKQPGAEEQTGWQSGEEERLCKEIHDRLARMVQKRRAERAVAKPEQKPSELPEA